jgi:predicted DNA-binding transcriptional regulator AlpA
MRLAAMAEIQKMLGGVSRQRASEIVKRPTFPAPLDSLTTGRIWSREAVAEWINQHRPSQLDD